MESGDWYHGAAASTSGCRRCSSRRRTPLVRERRRCSGTVEHAAQAGASGLAIAAFVLSLVALLVGMILALPAR